MENSLNSLSALLKRGRRGSLDKRHKERVRCVHQLVQEWEGTGPGPAPGMGKDWGQLSKVPSKGGKSYQIKQEGERWQKSQEVGHLT
jgi:hypothetical protein